MPNDIPSCSTRKLRPQYSTAVKSCLPVLLLALVTFTYPVRYLANMSSFHLTGGCTCGGLQYKVELDSADSARTSLCHCSSCKKAFGTNYGLTSKVSTPTTKSIAVSELTQVPDPDRELQIHKG